MPEMDLRQIDALVAEKVMGWPWRVWDGGKHTGKRFLADPLMEGWMAAQGAEPLRDDAYSLVPPFSSDIAAAWQVVERMLGTGWMCHMDHDSRNWFIEYAKRVDGKEVIRCREADTASLAICLAALKAVGAEVSEDD